MLVTADCRDDAVEADVADVSTDDIDKVEEGLGIDREEVEEVGEEEDSEEDFGLQIAANASVNTVQNAPLFANTLVMSVKQSSWSSNNREMYCNPGTRSEARLAMAPPLALLDDDGPTVLSS